MEQEQIKARTALESDDKTNMARINQIEPITTVTGKAYKYHNHFPKKQTGTPNTGTPVSLNES